MGRLHARSPSSLMVILSMPLLVVMLKTIPANLLVQTLNFCQVEQLELSNHMAKKTPCVCEPILFSNVVLQVIVLN
jgi:hypothetical protein